MTKSTISSWFRGLPNNKYRVPILVTVIVCLLALGLSDSRLLNFTLMGIYSMVGFSLFLVWGHTGMMSLGQISFFGLGGYAYGIIAINLIRITGESVTAVVAAVAIGAAVAAFLGYFLFYGRLAGVWLAIVTLVFTLVLYRLFGSTADPSYHIGHAIIGGFNGMKSIPGLTLGVPGVTSFTLGIKNLYVFTAAATGGVYIFLQFLIRSPFGRILAAVRENELRAELLGYDVRKYKFLSFVIAGGIAALGGVLYAAWGRFISPTVFSLTQAVLVLIWVLVGGRTVLAGAVVGTVIIQAVTNELGKITMNTPIILGIILILVVLLFPKGVVPAVELALRKMRKRRPDTENNPSGHGNPESYSVCNTQVINLSGNKEGIIETRDLGISFGGLQILDDVNLIFSRGLNCLIGPNGAGKSTCFNLLLGIYKPTKGNVFFNGEQIDKLKIFEHAKLGIGVKRQVPCLFYGLSVMENVWLAAYGPLHNSGKADLRAIQSLNKVGLSSERFAETAMNLSHGEQQLLEIAMVIAANPSIILMDEPSAGMTREEARNLAQLVREIGQSTTVVVVEHNMDFVRDLDAPVTVLHHGRVFAKGSLENLRNNKEVIDIYLGRRGHARN